MATRRQLAWTNLAMGRHFGKQRWQIMEDEAWMIYLLSGYALP